MWKQTPPNAAPIVWLCVLALFLGSGCVSSTGGAEEAMRLRRATSHFNLGLDYIRNEHLALGLRELLLAESFDPQNAQIHLALANAYWMRRKPDVAEEHYLRSLEIEPTFHEARLNLSVLYNRLDRHEDSLTHASILVDDATFPGPWRAYANKGLAEFRLGRVDEARRTLEIGFDYRDDYWPTLLYLGILEVEDGRQLEGLALFRQVLEQEPGLEAQAQANYRIGEIYIALGERERAIGHLRAAVVETPGGPWGVKSEEFLNLLR
ncbi:MAG: tetratricopeptide repeat protein [Deltaproteobacteria bacterium]|nr:tetratricopeptide repeat protein [Deltaproteobacteria bacterium]